MTAASAEPRMDYRKVALEAVEALRVVEGHARKSKIERRLPELIKLPASMMNGCAYCVGESEQRIYGLSAWRASIPMKKNRWI